MSAGFPIELRERIVAARAQGLSGRAIAALFNVGHSTVYRYLQKADRGESLEPGRPPGAERKLGDEEMAWLAEQLDADPYLTSYELADMYNRDHRRNRVHRSTILRAMHSLGFTNKKRRR